MEREGKVQKGDNKEVDHKRPLSKGGSNKRSNLRVVSRKKNRQAGQKLSVTARKKNGRIAKRKKTKNSSRKGKK